MNAHLKRHRETVHKHINDDGKGWACDCCGVKFESKKTLNFHMKNHWNTKFKCVKCKKIFQRATNLKNHMKLHGETLHEKCEHCEAGFATKNQLKQHLVSQHFTDKLQCQHCSSQFIRKHHYTRHIKTVHKQLDKGVMDALLQKIENIVTDYKELKFIRT